MKILIIGAGGVGGYFGARWAEAGLDVTLLARGEHHDAIASQGLKVVSPMGDCRVDIRVIDSFTDATESDLIVVATKTWQLDDILQPLSEIVMPQTLVVGLQNGVEAADHLTRVIRGDQVLAGTCRIISYIEQPGVIRHTGVEPTIIMGERHGSTPSDIVQLVEQLDTGNALTVKSSNDIQFELWKKFLFFAPVSGMGSVTQSPIGAFRAVPESRQMLYAAMMEVSALAQAQGIALHQSLVDATLKFIDIMPQDSTTSMQRDFADGRRSELDALAGAVVRFGKQHNVDTPVHAFMHAALLPRELDAREEYSRKEG